MERPRVELFVAGPLRAEQWPRRLAALWPRTPSAPSCLVASFTGEALLLGRHQAKETVLRGSSVAVPIARRATGGRALLAAEGTFAIALALPRTGALLGDGRDVPASKIVNRFVRPALGALGALGVSAGYFGRDFISVSTRPVAHASFDAGRDGSALVEVHVGLTRPVAFASEPPWASLAELFPDRFAAPPPLEKILEALRRGFSERLGADLGEPQPALDAAEPAWPAVDEDLPPRASRLHEVPIGWVEARVELDQLAARRLGLPAEMPVIGRARLLGDFEADAPSIQGLERALAGCPASYDEIGRRIDEHLGPRSGGTIVGLKTLKPLADALLEACR